MKPGSVVVVNFPGATGIKRRPAIAVSSEIYHVERPDLILAVVNTQVANAIAKTDFILQDWQAVDSIRHDITRPPNKFLIKLS